MEKLDEELKDNQAEQKNNMLQREQLISISKKAREEQDKLNASTQKTTQVKKEEISELEKFKNAYNGFTNTYKAQVELQEVLGDTQNKEKKNLENYIASLQAKVSLIGNFYTEAVKAGKGYLDEQKTIQLQELTGNKSIKGSAEDILNLYKEINDELEKQKKKYEEMNKPLVDIKSVVSQILGSIQNAYSSISSAMLQIASADLIDTSKFDEQIEHIQNKLDEFDEAQKEKEEEKQELDDEEYEAYLARLDEEYEKAVEANDLMSQEAIRIKKEELQKKKEEEKKQLEEEKKVNKEREELERQLAEAQYNKDYAEWQNQVKLAELQKNKAIADAVVIPALATAQAALGLASSFAQGGPIGFAAGVAWRNEVKRFIENYLVLVGTPDVKVEVGTPTKGSLLISEAKVNSINIESIFETKREDAIVLADYVKRTFKEVIKKEGNVIYIGQNTNTVGKLSIISDKDLLGQPQLINPNTITLTVPLTSKFRILQKIQLELESYIGYGQAFVTEGDPAGFGITAERIGKMYQGTYQIISIRPVMQSRNTDVNAWCTILEAVKIKDIKALNSGKQLL